MIKRGLQYIDDFEDDDDVPLFKVEKVNSQKQKENFLALLNKPTEEVNKNDDNKDLIIDNNENDGDLKVENIGRLKEMWNEEEDKEEKKEKEDKNEIKNIKEENSNIKNENNKNDLEEKSKVKNENEINNKEN